jgi:hypothetical protein
MAMSSKVFMGEIVICCYKNSNCYTFDNTQLHGREMATSRKYAAVTDTAKQRCEDQQRVS